MLTFLQADYGIKVVDKQNGQEITGLSFYGFIIRVFSMHPFLYRLRWNCQPQITSRKQKIFTPVYLHFSWHFSLMDKLFQNEPSYLFWHTLKLRLQCGYITQSNLNSVFLFTLCNFVDVKFITLENTRTLKLRIFHLFST